MTITDSYAKRDEIQALAVQKAIERLIEDKRAGLIVGTGVGKSKIAVDVAKQLARITDLTGPILIAIHGEEARDVDWPANLKKFGYTPDNLVIECYQTIYKWTGKHFTLVIADEVDFSLTPMYSKFYENNTIDYLLTMTGFVTEEKMELMELLAPICFKYSTQDAQKDGILNPTKFYEIHFSLGQVKRIPVKAGKYQFMQSENGAYEYVEKNYNRALFDFRDCDNKAKLCVLSDEDPEHWIKQKDKAFGQMKMWAGKRKTLLHKLESSRRVAKALIEQIHKHPGNKILLFSALTEQVDSICNHTFHSKNKEDDAVSKLDEGTINTLGVCQAINRAKNLKEVNVLIKESYVGSDTDFQQQHGRGVRLRPDQTMCFFVLIPYYFTKVKVKDSNGITVEKWAYKPTQAKEWADNMSSEFNFTPEVIDMIHDTGSDTYSFPKKYDNLCASS